MGCLLLILIPPSLRLKKSYFCSKHKSMLDYNPQHPSPMTILAKVTGNWFSFLFSFPFRGQHLTSVQQRTRNLFHHEEKGWGSCWHEKEEGRKEERERQLVFR